MVFSTPPTGLYETVQLTVMDRSSVTFDLLSCDAAHLALSSIPESINTLTYEVVLGHEGNTLVEIRDGKTIIYSTTSLFPLSTFLIYTIVKMQCGCLCLTRQTILNPVFCTQG